MTFSRAALALVLCGCAHAPASITVAAALPRAQQALALPEPTVDFGCGIYAKDGVTEDAAAYRVCVERAVAAGGTCEAGGSPALTTLELAVALIDGAGGPTDIPRARTLLAPCFRDVAVEEVLTHADAKEKDPHARPFEGCDAFAQTTFASTECIAEHVQNERAWLKRERRSYSASTRPLFDIATRAASEWQTKLGAIDYARYAGGTMRGAAMESQIFTAMRTRRDRLAKIHTWTPGELSSEDRAMSRQELVRARRELVDGAESEVIAAAEAEDKAWSAYRDAEADLYEALHPGLRQGALIELAGERTNALCTMCEP
jgi:hypothetical protein